MSSKTTSEWLESLEVGDKVVITDRIIGNMISFISRITKTQIVTVKGYKFRKDNGYLVGGSAWSSTRIVEETEEIVSRIKKDRLIDKIKKFISKTEMRDWSISELTELKILLTRQGFLEDQE